MGVRRSEAPGHIRTPYYVRGVTGVVERVCGSLANPEELAYGRAGLPAEPLYRIRFRHPDSAALAHTCGGAADSVDVAIFEHWLEPA